MKVIVDRDLCEGHARCVEAAPGVFEIGDDDEMRIIDENPGEERRRGEWQDRHRAADGRVGGLCRCLLGRPAGEGQRHGQDWRAASIASPIATRPTAPLSVWSPTTHPGVPEMPSWPAIAALA